MLAVAVLTWNLGWYLTVPMKYFGDCEADPSGCNQALPDYAWRRLTTWANTMANVVCIACVLLYLRSPRK